MNFMAFPLQRVREYAVNKAKALLLWSFLREWRQKRNKQINVHTIVSGEELQERCYKEK